jgi:hypothetical protein
MFVRLMSCVGIFSMLSLVSASASAHCDTMDGPVIGAANQTGDKIPESRHVLLFWRYSDATRELGWTITTPQVNRQESRS